MQINGFKNFSRKTILAATIAGAAIAGGTAIKNNSQVMQEAKITKECLKNDVNPYDSYGRALIGTKVYVDEKYPKEAAMSNELAEKATHGKPYYDAVLEGFEELGRK